MKRVAMKRKTPMKRGKPMKRKAGELDATLKRYHGFGKRKKRLGPGKKTQAKRLAMASAVLCYFSEFGWIDSGGGYVAFDQVTGRFLRIENATAHHKVPRSELRKAGVKDLDAPERLIIVDRQVHIAWVHDMQMGRPKVVTHMVTECPDGKEYALVDDSANRRFAIIENSSANAYNGLAVEWGDQDRLDLDRFLGEE